MSVPYVDPSELWEFISSIEQEAEICDLIDTTGVPPNIRRQLIREWLEAKYESAVKARAKAKAFMDGESGDYFIGQWIYWDHACSFTKWLIHHTKYIK